MASNTESVCCGCSHGLLASLSNSRRQDRHPKAAGEKEEKPDKERGEEGEQQEKEQAPGGIAWHGQLCKAEWPSPRCVAAAGEEARPGFSTCKADEYEDEPAVMAAKAALVADLIRRSSHTVAYTGAGISTSSGINDYATKAHNSAIHRKRATDINDSFDTQPTEAHRVFAALHRGGLLAHWLQQNHDGLPQKAGVPQDVVNEIHGAWFDPSNPVVHFRAELRPDLFTWMLEEELRADLVIAVGTSLCDTPSTADRFVVTTARRAQETPPTALGAVIVGLQKTRLDERVQLKVYGLIDAFFSLVAQELWGSPWQAHAPPALVQSSELGAAVKGSLGEGGDNLTPGQLVYISAGPLQGKSCRILTSDLHYVKLDYGARLGSWWLRANVHPAIFPVSIGRVRPPSRFTGALEAAVRMESLPAMTGPPLAFLQGVWQGDAVLISQDRSQHPTAPEDRAQHFCWVLGQGREEDSLLGAGFTTWPAAHVMLSTRSRVWYTLRGTYKPEAGYLEISVQWEAVPGSRFKDDGLGPGQGSAKCPWTHFCGRVWWDDNLAELRMGGIWSDSEGVKGAFVLAHEDPTGQLPSQAGTWTSLGEDPDELWVLSVRPGIMPSIFGAVVRHEASTDDTGLHVLRGFVDQDTICVREVLADGQSACNFVVAMSEVGQLQISDRAGAPKLKLQLQKRYGQLQPSEIRGVYHHSAGGVVEITEDGDGMLLIRNPRLREPARVRATDACTGGSARLFKQLGRLVAGPSRSIEWSNGTVWARVMDDDRRVEQTSASGVTKKDALSAALTRPQRTDGFSNTSHAAHSVESTPTLHSYSHLLADLQQDVGPLNAAKWR